MLYCIVCLSLFVMAEASVKRRMEECIKNAGQDPRRLALNKKKKDKKEKEKKEKKKPTFKLSEYTLCSPLTKDEVNELTTDQGDCELWHRLRCGRATGSTIYAVQQAGKEYRKKQANKPELLPHHNVYIDNRLRNIAHQVVLKGSSSSPLTKDGRRVQDLPAIKWGHNQEATAIEEYKRLSPKATVERRGFTLHPEEACMGVSPDGIVTVDGKKILLEVKCPVSRKDDGLDKLLTTTVLKDKKNKTRKRKRDTSSNVKEEGGQDEDTSFFEVPEQVVKPKPFYAKRVEGEVVAGTDLHVYELMKHRQADEYKAQVLFSLYCLGLDQAHLFMWTPQNSGVVVIDRDLEWEKTYVPLFRNYVNKYLIPEAILSGNFLALPSDVVMRDPLPSKYICFACQEITAKKMGEAMDKEEEEEQAQEQAVVTPVSSNSSDSDVESDNGDDHAPPPSQKVKVETDVFSDA